MAPKDPADPRGSRSAPAVGSRYQLRVASGSAPPSDYHAIHPADAAALTAAPVADGRLVGHVHSVEVGSTVDGPGIRYVLFLTGCALRCQYCHNPDTWHLLNGRPHTLNAVLKDLGRYAEALRVSRGGVTLSGGEPLLQTAFSRAVLKGCRQLGLHTCLDTSGFLGARFSDADLELVDLQLLDIKSGDPETYARVTRQPLQPTLDYARRLSELGRPTWVRFVLVPGLTDAWDNVERVADVCAGIRSLQRVEILRFHQLGRDKWHRLGVPYALEHTPTPDPDLVDRVRGQFRARGLTVY